MRWALKGPGVNAGTVDASQARLLAAPFADPFYWQIFWEDFSWAPPLAAVQTFGWQVAGTGSAANVVGLAMLGGGQTGEGGSSITIATGGAANNTTLIFPAPSLGLGFAPFVQRLGFKAAWILAGRVSRFRQSNANCQIAMQGAGVPTTLLTPSSGPGFQSVNGVVSFVWGPNLSIPITGLKPDGNMVFDDLLAYYAGGYLTLFCNGANLGSTAADAAALDTNGDQSPIFGVQTLTAQSRGIGVDYFLFAGPREPV